MTPLHPHWRELYREVVDPGLCTGCAGCVVACPRDVLVAGDDDLPVQVGPGMGVDECVIGDRGCDVCTRACPRFRTWEPELDTVVAGRPRTDDEVFGPVRRLLLTRATDPSVNEVAQDGGLVSGLLIWGLETGRIDGALTSKITDNGLGPFDAAPTVVTDRAGVLETAGSRYTFSANPLAFDEAVEAGLRRLALVGMSCQASIPAALAAHGERRVARRIAVTIGLLCSKTFTYEGQSQVLAEHGVAMNDVTKINIKGTFRVWTNDGGYQQIPLKLFHPHTRPACQTCPDFAAQHADISAGGIGDASGWTLTIVRTEVGERWIDDAIADGEIEARPAESDEAAMRLLTRLSTMSRRRWPSAEEAGIPIDPTPSRTGE
ncbi:MAG: Coenzyme F420 hydrogenase/dehydrogenase, beta subunit C-terminal domain [Nitriliruptoraceae bacterium]